jgi:hypothetical protein
LGNAWSVLTLTPSTDVVAHDVHAHRSILHDPKVYPSPEEYIPERWLKDGQLDPNAQNPAVAAFGFGRRQVERSPLALIPPEILCRICPGRYLSDNSLYAMISLVLAVYNVIPPVDDQGNPIQLKPQVTSGLLS